jgi:hypothetical protein
MATVTRVMGNKEGNIMVRVARAMMTAMRVVGKCGPKIK